MRLELVYPDYPDLAGYVWFSSLVPCAQVYPDKEANHQDCAVCQDFPECLFHAVSSFRPPSTVLRILSRTVRIALVVAKTSSSSAMPDLTTLW